MGQPSVVRQLQRLALHVGQQRQRRRRPVARFAVDRQILRAVGRHRGAERITLLTVTVRLLGSHAVDGAAVGDRGRPGAHAAALVVVAPAVAPHVDEDLLGDLLGLGAVTEHPLDHAEDQRRDRVVQLGERALVALGRAIEQDGEFIHGDAPRLPDRSWRRERREGS